MPAISTQRELHQEHPAEHQPTARQLAQGQRVKVCPLWGYSESAKRGHEVKIA